jgi:hypothetical protein
VTSAALDARFNTQPALRFDQAAAMAQLRSSLLHRTLRIRPGAAPSCLIARNDCTGADVILGMAAATFMLGLFAWQSTQGGSVALFTASAALFYIASQAQECERFARARIRRGECAQCGAKLEAASSAIGPCNTCSRGL